MSFKFGMRSNVPEKMKSRTEPIELTKTRLELTMNGASAEVEKTWELEPMCMHSVVPVSTQVRNRGSQ